MLLVTLFSIILQEINILLNKVQDKEVHNQVQLQQLKMYRLLSKTKREGILILTKALSDTKAILGRAYSLWRIQISFHRLRSISWINNSTPIILVNAVVSRTWIRYKQLKSTAKSSLLFCLRNTTIRTNRSESVINKK